MTEGPTDGRRVQRENDRGETTKGETTTTTRQNRLRRRTIPTINRCSCTDCTETLA